MCAESEKVKNVIFYFPKKERVPNSCEDMLNYWCSNSSCIVPDIPFILDAHPVLSWRIRTDLGFFLNTFEIQNYVNYFGMLLRTSSLLLRVSILSIYLSFRKFSFSFLILCIED